MDLLAAQTDSTAGPSGFTSRLLRARIAIPERRPRFSSAFGRLGFSKGQRTNSPPGRQAAAIRRTASERLHCTASSSAPVAAAPPRGAGTLRCSPSGTGPRLEMFDQDACGNPGPGEHRGPVKDFRLRSIGTSIMEVSWAGRISRPSRLRPRLPFGRGRAFAHGPGPRWHRDSVRDRRSPCPGRPRTVLSSRSSWSAKMDRSRLGANGVVVISPPSASGPQPTPFLHQSPSNRPAVVRAEFRRSSEAESAPSQTETASLAARAMLSECRTRY